METTFLIWIHGWSHPWLDTFFRISHMFGTSRWCIVFVAIMAVWHGWRRQWRHVVVWVVLGVLVANLSSGLKWTFGRPRPELWARPVSQTNFAMPSGHALASAALYPVFALGTARLAFGRMAPVVAVALPLWIGVGRLYLGVHWPSDVLVGWSIGVVLAVASLRLQAPPVEETPG